MTCVDVTPSNLKNTYILLKKKTNWYINYLKKNTCSEFIYEVKGSNIFLYLVANKHSILLYCH